MRIVHLGLFIALTAAWGGSSAPAEDAVVPLPKPPDRL